MQPVCLVFVGPVWPCQCVCQACVASLGSLCAHCCFGCFLMGWVPHDFIVPNGKLFGGASVTNSDRLASLFHFGHMYAPLLMHLQLFSG